MRPDYVESKERYQCLLVLMVLASALALWTFVFGSMFRAMRSAYPLTSEHYRIWFFRRIHVIWLGHKNWSGDLHWNDFYSSNGSYITSVSVGTNKEKLSYSRRARKSSCVWMDTGCIKTAGQIFQLSLASQLSMYILAHSEIRDEFLAGSNGGLLV